MRAKRFARDADCPKCAAYVAGFIEEGCERDYKRDGKRVER